MQIQVTFKNLAPSDALKAYVSEKLNRLDKFLENPAEASAVLTVEKFRHLAEITISGDRLTINAKEETHDMYSAIDMVVDKLEKQIKKSKQKSRRRHTYAKAGPKHLYDQSEEGIEAGEPPQVVIQNIEYKPMGIDEAVLQMGLTDNTFLVFTNARTDQVNVLYRRSDKNYGLIQPNV